MALNTKKTVYTGLLIANSHALLTEYWWKPPTRQRIRQRDIVSNANLAWSAKIPSVYLDISPIIQRSLISQANCVFEKGLNSGGYVYENNFHFPG
jgi:hypothetical protein